MNRSVFVDDQIEAAAIDNEQRIVAAAHTYERAHHVQAHPAESAIAATLAQAIGGLPLCAHVNATTPTRLVWAPGMNKLGCAADFIEHRTSQPVHRCDCCGDVVPRDEGAMAFAVGPVMVFAIVCPACLNAPSVETTDTAASIRRVNEHLSKRWAA